VTRDDGERNNAKPRRPECGIRKSAPFYLAIALRGRRMAEPQDEIDRGLSEQRFGGINQQNTARGRRRADRHLGGWGLGAWGLKRPAVATQLFPPGSRYRTHSNHQFPLVAPPFADERAVAIDRAAKQLAVKNSLVGTG
jgi:hypothetical protein